MSEERIKQLYKKIQKDNVLQATKRMRKLKEELGEDEFVRQGMHLFDTDKEFSAMVEKYFWLLMSVEDVSEIMNSKFARWHRRLLERE